jgi:hypothetical protein
MRLGLFLAVYLMIAASGAHAADASIHLLTRAEASAALTDSAAQGYYAQLQLAEMRAKTGLPLKDLSLDAARAAASKAYGAATEDFADDESAALRDAVESMQPVLSARAPLYARTPWCFIKVNGTIEGGLPHTRGDCIVLAEGVLQALTKAHAQGKFDHPSGVWALLLHEQTHVLQRRNPTLFAGLFTDVFGFRQVEVLPPDWLRVRRVINPDAPLVEWIYPLGKDAARHWVLPDLELLELDHPHMPADFRVVALGVHEVNGRRWAIDDLDLPATQADLESVADYVDAFPVKGEAFHPNEIAAEMLAEIITAGRMQNPQHELWARTRQWADKALR